MNPTFRICFPLSRPKVAVRLTQALLLAAIALLTTAACVGNADELGEAPAGAPTSDADGSPAASSPSDLSAAPDGAPYPGLPTMPPGDTAGVAPDESYPGPDVDDGPSGTSDESAPLSTTPGTSGEDLIAPGYEIVAVLQDWSEFHSDAELEEAIGRNLGAGGDNSMTLSLAPDGGQRLDIGYVIDELDPHDFVGFNRDLGAEQDWTGATHVGVQIEPVPGAEEDVVLQWREDSREVWRYAGPLGEVPESGLLLIPLEEGSFDRAIWSGLDNGEIDLGSVNQYGLYVGHVGPGVSGKMTVGPILILAEQKSD